MRGAPSKSKWVKHMHQLTPESWYSIGQSHPYQREFIAARIQDRQLSQSPRKDGLKRFESGIGSKTLPSGSSAGHLN